MRVLIVSSLYPPHIGGGAEIITHQHALALKRRGVEVAVLTVGPEAGLVRDEVDGIPVWRAGIRNMYFHHAKVRPAAWRRLAWHLRDSYNPLMKPYVRKVVQEFRPEIASCHNIAGWSVAAWDALSACDVPIVQVLHDQYLLCPRSTMFRYNAPCRGQCLGCRLMRLVHPAKSNQVRAAVGVSRFIIKKLVDSGYFAQTPIREAIHNARHFDFDPATVPGRAEDGKMVFGFIGTLAANKGIELLLETFTRTAEPDWRLLVAGSGTQQYEAHLKGRFADPRVLFLGQSTPRDFFPQVDALVVPSLVDDTFPTVVLESLLFGIPVIGSQRGGIPEMVGRGMSGLLFDPAQEESLAVALRQMADGKGEYRSARERISASAAPFKDEEAWAARWLSLYRRVLAVPQPVAQGQLMPLVAG